MDRKKMRIDVHRIYIVLSQKYGWIPFEIGEMDFNFVIYLWQFVTGESIKNLIIKGE